MAGITPIYSLPYQSLTDPPHGPNLGQNLAEAVEAELQRIDAAVTAGDSRLFARRIAPDTTITNNAALADDRDLVVQVPANAVYEVRSFIVYASGTIPDLKVGWSAPAGATFTWNVGGPASSQDTTTGTPYNGVNTLAGTDVLGGAGGTDLVARPSGLLVTAGTAGPFRFRWSQNVSDAFGTAVRSSSYLLLTRVG